MTRIIVRVILEQDPDARGFDARPRTHEGRGAARRVQLVWLLTCACPRFLDPRCVVRGREDERAEPAHLLELRPYDRIRGIRSPELIPHYFERVVGELRFGGIAPELDWVAPELDRVIAELQLELALGIDGVVEVPHRLVVDHIRGTHGLR